MAYEKCCTTQTDSIEAPKKKMQTTSFKKRWNILTDIIYEMIHLWENAIFLVIYRAFEMYKDWRLIQKKNAQVKLII